MSRKKTSKVLVPNGEFVKWAMCKVIEYGSGITLWWKVRGRKDFFRWAKENGFEYTKELEK